MIVVVNDVSILNERQSFSPIYSCDKGTIIEITSYITI